MLYEEKLKDPRWQKMRLEVMGRDKFTCQICGSGINDGTPLNVHHKVYRKGKEPWEYGKNEFITLCEECHRKVHEHKILLPEVNKNSFPITVVYKKLFGMREKFTGTDAIVYSNLLRLSLRGTIVKSEDEYIKMYSIKNKNLAQICLCSERAITYSIKYLKEIGYIRDSDIYSPSAIINGGYLKLLNVKDLKGWELILYSFIKERSKYYNGPIDTYAYRIAELLGTTTNTIYGEIHRLKERGYVERLKDGLLLVK